MFDITQNCTMMQCAAYEPIIYSVQFADSSGQVVESLADKTIAWAVYTADRKQVHYVEGTRAQNEFGDIALFVLDGTFSDSLFQDNPNTRWDLGLLGDNGHQQISTGNLKIEGGAPYFRDVDSAPIGRYIINMVRCNDVDTLDKPVWKKTISAWSSITKPPANTALPAVTGTLIEGQVLSASTGTWSNDPTSFAYQWLRDGVPILNAKLATYKLASGDVGHRMSVRVAAANADGTSQATSSETAKIDALPERPTMANTPISSQLSLGEVDGALAAANGFDARIAAIIAMMNGGEAPTMANTPISSSLTLGQVPGALMKANEQDARIRAVAASLS